MLTFVTESLYPLEVRTNRMFGVMAIYVGEKICFATRQNTKNPADNGLWIGTSLEHHESLKADFPSITNMQSIRIKKWLLLPETAAGFEETVQELCQLVVAEDERIGVIPPRKKKRNKAT